MDDPLLLGRSQGPIDRQMRLFGRLGVDRVRVSAFWSGATSTTARSTTRPAGSTPPIPTTRATPGLPWSGWWTPRIGTESRSCSPSPHPRRAGPRSAATDCGCRRRSHRRRPSSAAHPRPPAGAGPDREELGWALQGVLHRVRLPDRPARSLRRDLPAQPQPLSPAGRAPPVHVERCKRSCTVRRLPSASGRTFPNACSPP